MHESRYFGGRLKGLHLAIAAFVLSLFLLLCAAGGGLYLVTHKTQTNANFSMELRNGLVENCETNGNSLREVLVKTIEGEILSVDDPRIPQVFPDVPKEVADRIVREGNRKKHEEIQKIKPVDCQAQYPASP